MSRLIKMVGSEIFGVSDDALLSLMPNKTYAVVSEVGDLVGFASIEDDGIVKTICAYIDAASQVWLDFENSVDFNLYISKHSRNKLLISMKKNQEYGFLKLNILNDSEDID
jgi:hypothetical protein